MPKRHPAADRGLDGRQRAARAWRSENPDQMEASVLYLDRDTRRLQAWDEIKLGGLGLTTAEVSRHLPEENRPGATPVSTRRSQPSTPSP